jgi:hypothetical protein
MFGQHSQGQFARLTATGQVRAGQGILLGFMVASGTPTIKLWDSLTGAGTILLNTMQTTAATWYPLPACLNTGLFATITGAADITFIYQ